MSYTSLPFGLVRKEKKLNLIYQKTMMQVNILKGYLTFQKKIRIFKIRLLTL